MLLTNDQGNVSALNRLLASVSNFRDLAGTDSASPYSTADGRALRRGVFYRANVLTPNAADWEKLNHLGISAVYDLRAPDEIAKTPDHLPQGAQYIPINVLGTPQAGIPELVNSANQAIAFIQTIQRAWVTDSSIRSRFARVLSTMANTEGAQVFHCTAGKDRTGWVAALLHSIAGVSFDVIMHDYLLSNAHNQAWMQNLYEQLQHKYGQTMADAFKPLLGVQANFLNAGWEQAIASYGSIDHYLRFGLSLSDQVLEQLRAKLLA